MRVQNQNGEKNQAELVGGGFAFLINAAIAPKMDGKRTVSFFLVRHCIPIGKEGMFGIKRCGFFYTKTKCILVFLTIFPPIS
ncbi:hypothetical protein PAHAL_5G439500 [Panicum hallii]|jgi:hypothetical protein|uniref:Uncharacterized protein n=1 Tax=Panicum hallii TaxID=206008 RepID=A0A2T8INA8_9POAL|nr:hypothetical protein PAHAL_5G439500 [Panicum hallii]